MQPCQRLTNLVHLNLGVQEPNVQLQLPAMCSASLSKLLIGHDAIKSLTHISIGRLGPGLVDTIMPSLNGAQQLRGLKIIFDRTPAAAYFTGLTQLTSLSAPMTAALSSLTSLKSLQLMRAGDLPRRPLNIGLLSSLPNLTQLTVDRHIPIAGDGLSLLTSLKEFELGYGSVYGQLPCRLPPSLQTLTCDLDTMASFQRLPGLQHLRTLWTFNKSVRRSIVGHIIDFMSHASDHDGFISIKRHQDDNIDSDDDVEESDGQGGFLHPIWLTQLLSVRLRELHLHSMRVLAMDMEKLARMEWLEVS